MFLIGCLNTMKDIEYLVEMDNPTNLRTVVSKLPYKMRKRWRAVASDPIFGNIPDSRPTTSGKADQKEKYSARKEIPGSSFATNVSAENKRPQETC